MNLTQTLAKAIYENDAQPAPFDRGIPEEVRWCTDLADVLVDIVVAHLRQMNPEYEGAFTAAADYLDTSAEIRRLRDALSG